MALTDTYTIDAAGRTLGRVASEAAKALMGKTRPDYTPNIESGVKVSIVNVSKLHITEKKRRNNIYKTYSGYPGGLRVESFASLDTRRGRDEAIKRTIRRMLPRNSMLVARMKNLTISQ